MPSSRGRRACCRQEHCSSTPCLLSSVVVPDLKFTQQRLSATETSQLTCLLPRHACSEHTLCVTPCWPSVLELQELLSDCELFQGTANIILPCSWAASYLSATGCGQRWYFWTLDYMMRLCTILSDLHLCSLWRYWLHTHLTQLPKWDHGCDGN